MAREGTKARFRRVREALSEDTRDQLFLALLLLVSTGSGKGLMRRFDTAGELVMPLLAP
jgi:hypothetical protein